jgi:hypothetical protein
MPLTLAALSLSRSPCAGDALDPQLWKILNKALPLTLSISLSLPEDAFARASTHACVRAHACMLAYRVYLVLA